MNEGLLAAAKQGIAEKGNKCESCSHTDECALHWIVNHPDAEDLDVMAKLCTVAYLDSHNLSNSLCMMMALVAAMKDEFLGDLLVEASMAAAVFYLKMEKVQKAILDKYGR